MERIFLGLLYKLTQPQACMLAMLENRRPLRSQSWSHYRSANPKFFCRFIGKRILKKQKRRFLPCYSSKISSSYLSFDVLLVISPLFWLIESTPPESDHRHYLPSGIFSMYVEWNAPTDVLRGADAFIGLLFHSPRREGREATTGNMSAGCGSQAINLLPL